MQQLQQQIAQLSQILHKPMSQTVIVIYNFIVYMMLFRSLFRMSKPKIPTIEEVRKEWDDFSTQYNTFDVGPQTLFFSLANILQLQRADNILEVACGTGKLLSYVLQKKQPKARYLASDLSPNMVELARLNLQSHFSRYHSKLSFQKWCQEQRIAFGVINAEQSFESEPFDRMICNCALMLTEDPAKMLSTLASKARQGCLFGLSVWGSRSENNLFKAIQQSILENGFSLPEERSKFHLYKKVGELAGQTGWEVVLNWEQNTLFPVLEYSPDKNTELFHFQVNKLPEQIREKVRATLEGKLYSIFQDKKGVNFSCDMYVLRKK